MSNNQPIDDQIGDPNSLEEPLSSQLSVCTLANFEALPGPSGVSPSPRSDSSGWGSDTDPNFSNLNVSIDSDHSQSSDEEESTLQLKITLLNITPEIWRRIHISNKATFEHLHFCIQETMGWSGNHFHKFQPGECQTNKCRYINPMKEKTLAVKECLKSLGDSVYYVYGFQNGYWEHRIELEEFVWTKDELPRCVGGERAGPPEECKGVAEYKHLLGVWKDPQHGEHERLVRENPGFDPEKFDNRAKVLGREFGL